MHSQQKLASIYKKLMVNKTFHHFKGTDYKVTNIAVHSETGELRVIYSPNDNSEVSWDRNLENFLSPVDKEKYLNTIKGFVDIINSGDIYFYQDNFDTNEIIEKYTKTFNNEINGSLSYCGTFNGKTVLKWEPITKS